MTKTQKETLRNIRRTELAKHLLTGSTFDEARRNTQRALHLDTYARQTAHTDRLALLEEWKENRLNNTEQLKTYELAEIAMIQNELWKAWEASKGGAECPQGNAEYIKEFARQGAERRKVLGLYAPKKEEHTHSTFAETMIKASLAGQPLPEEPLICADGQPINLDEV